MYVVLVLLNIKYGCNYRLHSRLDLNAVKTIKFFRNKLATNLCYYHI